MLDRGVGARLDRLEITRATFASICCLNQGLFSLYLTGQAVPSPTTEEKIMSVLEELEAASRMLPYLPNFRGTERVLALLAAFRNGEFARYEQPETVEAAPPTA
jgi:hypothetical protein